MSNTTGGAVAASQLSMPSLVPAAGSVTLRAFRSTDVPMIQNLSSDPYVPMIGSLDHDAPAEQAATYIDRQHDRLISGIGFSFCVADVQTDEPLGQAGLWLRELPSGRATAGYAIAPVARGQGRAAEALVALTAFGWSLSQLHRIELYIEPWNVASLRTADAAGYICEGLLRSHQAIGGRRVDMLLYASIRADGA
ncbi:GNAT family N-acetyltransferase [Microlunatus sp. Gsoil 973]|nr:GNAT family N-acetyltransferase [Microlunatus sp. Gsoil 973]